MTNSRRDFLRNTAVTLGAASAALPGAALPSAGSAVKSEPPFRLIFETEWNDIACADYPLTPERWVEECMHQFLNTQVDTILYNLCSSDGYVAELKSGEFIIDTFDKVADAWVWRYKENPKKLAAAGGNPPKLACEYGHRQGLKVIPIVRMNDPHDQYFKYEVSHFKKQSPQFMLGYGKYPINWEGGYKALTPELKTGMDAVTWGFFDFSHPEVRAHKLAIINEFITRWDNDGIALDFERDPRYFKEYSKPENAALMTDMIRTIKGTLDRTGKERGRKLYFHVRVLPKIETCYERGLDVNTWVKEGLVDAISPGCGYMTVSLDLKPWIELVNGRNCWIYPCSNHWRTTEETRAWAQLMYQRGAHGVQLFNYGHLLFGHDVHTPPQAEKTSTVWFADLAPDYYQVLQELDQPKRFEFKDKRYVLESYPHERIEGEGGLTFREFRAIDNIVLPVRFDVGTHRVPFGFADDIAEAKRQGCSPRVTLRLKVFNYTEPDDFDVAVNGQMLPIHTRRTRAVFIMNNDTWITYPVPIELMKVGDNYMELSVRSVNPHITEKPILRNVEVLVEYGTGVNQNGV